MKEYLGSKRLWEATVRLANESLQELDNRSGKFQVIRLFKHCLLVQLLGDHVLGQITHYFGRRCHLKKSTS